MESKLACLVYVDATESLRDGVKAELTQKGFSVCTVKVSMEEALAAKANLSNAIDPLNACLHACSVSVFLLPEDEFDDNGLGVAASMAASMGKLIIGLVGGTRKTLPDELEDYAHSIVCVGSASLDKALQGIEIWEAPDGTSLPARRITHIKCQ